MQMRRAPPYNRAMNKLLSQADLHLRWLAAGAIAHEAGQLVRTRFYERDQAMEIEFKGPQDYLTETDAEVEQLIAQRLEEAFPDDGFFGEESGGAYTEQTWIVDPIDGTASFARGVPYFCVSIAFLAAGKVQVGVLYDPMAGELFAAQRGRGATLNGRPIRVSHVDDPSKAVVELGWTARTPVDRHIDIMRRINALGASIKRVGSGALGLAYVAAGRQDAYFEQHINAWDAAAAVLLVEEAGGYVNDFLTPECLERGNRVFACTPKLREALQAAIDPPG